MQHFRGNNELIKTYGYKELPHNKAGSPKFCFVKVLMCLLFKKEENVLNITRVR
jgi:hypothetical protein